MTPGNASHAPAEDRDMTNNGLLPAFGSPSNDEPDQEPYSRDDTQGRRQPPPAIDTRLGVAQLPLVDEDEQAERAKEKPVTWSSLPQKDQLIILTLARLSEPLTQTSLQAYMFYQLKSFDPSLPDSTIASQAGILQGAFTATQFVTAVLWGRVADVEWVGRKKVILVGLLGTAISAVGFGFSKSFVTAVVFRSLGGMLNGNIGVMRTMVSEIVKEKRYQSRAFLLLPMTFNIGIIIGPILGGFLADPAGSYPSLFGPGSVIGGKDGVGWMMEWPYALPNLVSALFLFCSSMAIIFGLKETHEALQDTPDFGIRLRLWVSRNILRRRRPQGDYMPIPTDDDDRPRTPDQPPTDIEMATTPTTPDSFQIKTPPRKQKLPFHRIWTRNVLLTFLSHAILSMHIGTLNSLWFTFLSTPRFDPAHPIPPTLTHQRPPLHFTGGLGLPPSRIGAALAILGVIGITLQLAVYPTVSTRLGTVRSFRFASMLFPVAYAVIPFLALIPTTSPPPAPAAGPLVWMAIAGALFLVVAARTFATPSAAILVNNCCPHPSVLGTVHGVGQSVSSGARTLGPVLGGWVFGRGLAMGVVGLAWWWLAGVAVCGAVAGTFVREGNGREIVLPGEEEKEEEEDEDEEGDGGVVVVERRER
ncbi:MFS multidrug transporter [Lasiodiplodia theobromae]|uniref:MFS multidrug transporter n=1 Tax=Lasiodiplodia theobromae TaxID=45133 RepID=UPI0015C303AF|nr:MFS multidrug transporter [Lasiodiplodia theobromae]KAF4546749.1 MFS multidrug transporter [Lasiodiplodia theobromae]